MVSILVPCFNCKNSIKQTLDSILIQGIDDIEVIIVDDGSTDGSLEYVREIYGNDKRFHLWQSLYNVGVADTRNVAFNNSCGEFIALLDSDDIWEEGKLQKQLDLLLDSNADICCTGASVMNNDGTSCNKFRFVDENITFKNMLKDNMVINSSVVMRRKTMDEFSFRPEFFHEDYVFWLECLRNNFVIVGINEPLLKYRLGGRSQNKINAAKHRWKIYRKFLHFGIFRSLNYMYFYTKNAITKQ